MPASDKLEEGTEPQDALIGTADDYGSDASGDDEPDDGYAYKE
jgi:hypothetical protein